MNCFSYDKYLLMYKSELIAKQQIHWMYCTDNPSIYLSYMYFLLITYFYLINKKNTIIN